MGDLMASKVGRLLVGLALCLGFTFARQREEMANVVIGSQRCKSGAPTIQLPPTTERSRVPNSPDEGEAERIERAADRDDSRSVERRCGKNQRAALRESTSPAIGKDPPWPLGWVLRKVFGLREREGS